MTAPSCTGIHSDGKNNEGEQQGVFSNLFPAKSTAGNTHHFKSGCFRVFMGLIALVAASGGLRHTTIFPFLFTNKHIKAGHLARAVHSPALFSQGKRGTPQPQTGHAAAAFRKVVTLIALY